MHFRQLRMYFVEFYFLDFITARPFLRRNTKLKLLANSALFTGSLSKTVYCNLLQFSLFYLQIIRLKQQIFFFTSFANFISHRPLIFDNNQAYTDRKGKLWGVTNRNILSNKQITKGRESALIDCSGLIVNLSSKLLKPVKYRYLLERENALASVGYGFNTDYPLFTISSNRREHFLFLFLHLLQRRLLNQRTVAESTFLLQGLLTRRRWYVRSKLRKQKFKALAYKYRYSYKWRTLSSLAIPSVPRLCLFRKRKKSFLATRNPAAVLKLKLEERKSKN